MIQHEIFAIDEFDSMKLYRNVVAKPFLKWAGGKSQLLNVIDGLLPQELKDRKIHRYIEPFVGAGALFFHIINKYNIADIILIDNNKELILCYLVIQNNVNSLIDELQILSNEYYSNSDTEREEMFYRVRHEFNENRTNIDFKTFHDEWILRAAQIIFMNKTCFNGLFRLNRKGEFNVPFGKYRNPSILNINNLFAVSAALQNAKIIRGDFSDCTEFLDDNTFVYFDPPYKPLNPTSHFTAYSESEFDDNSQRKLSNLYRELNRKHAKLMLSNSDPKNADIDNNFFDDLYEGFSIRRVDATRMINCKAEKRGLIKEIIITNY